jgi:endo-1,4-beta-mannosidase
MPESFLVGVNYWPARTAMGWWADFDRGEVAADFARIAANGLDSVRLFLVWEDFQPAPDELDRQMLERLVTVADLAGGAGLAIVPTLFTGHMSGVNWVPAWALGGSDGDDRFRVVSGGEATRAGLRNWYTDSVVAEAQALFAAEAAAALAGHAALWAWDLGNENSNCVVPPTRSSAQSWLERITTAIRTADETTLITVGLHMEDLEQDRKLGPQEVSESCDLLSMHGYPIYADWAEGPTDEQLLPFLAHITRWLGQGRDVLFSEFGLPTYRSGDPAAEHARRRSSSPLVEEHAAATYTERALDALRAAGCAGAMLWCYTDYDEAIWEKPPLDLAVHERSFGLWRADGSPEPSAPTIPKSSGGSTSNRTSSSSTRWCSSRVSTVAIAIATDQSSAGAVSTASSRSSSCAVARQIVLSAPP